MELNSMNCENERRDAATIEAVAGRARAGYPSPPAPHADAGRGEPESGVKVRLRRGFTLVELMIAMTITLLLMAALGRSFASIGRTMKQSRAQVTLSSKLRGISFRLRTDLKSRTTNATPPVTTQSGAGYFMAYEGPLTEHTFGLFGAEPTQTTTAGAVVGYSDPRFNDPSNSSTYRRQSRFGDFDDYLAFTAEAPGDDWFTGKVPAYLVDDTAADPMEPRVIRSKYAEIIIWASPVWDIDPATNSLVTARPTSRPQIYPAARGVPLYKDDNNDFVPDSVVLHQRILLIRPDLNATIEVVSGTGGNFQSNLLRPVGGVANNTVPLSSAVTHVPAVLSNVYPINSGIYPNYVVAGSLTDNSLMLTSNWLVGMAPLHQFYDLSLRRVFHPRTGDPTGFVAANSLQDLVQPHNRFAHVRYPGRYFGRGTATGDTATSMPLLALGWNDALLNWQGNADTRSVPSSATAPAWFPGGHPSPRTYNGGATGVNQFNGFFNGWLLPHFELGDPNQTSLASSQQWQRGYLTTANFDGRWDRTGEDVIASNILAFDIRGFDPTAPLFLTAGPDRAAGRATVDDDGSGTTDQTDAGAINGSELGAIGSDDVVIRTSDIGISEVVKQSTLVPIGPNNSDVQMLAGRGDFVDLFYPYLAGSSLLDSMAQCNVNVYPTTPAMTHAATPNGTISSNYDLMRSSLSGLAIDRNDLTPIKQSGKLLHRNGSGDIVYFQPTYDTWTDLYEFDGFDQTQTTTGAVGASPLVGTTWVLNDANSFQVDPRIPATPVPPGTPQIDTGKAIAGSPETLPPVAVPLPAVQVTVRVADPASGEMTQFSVVEGLQ